jgi:hypothetical protein
MLGLVADRLRRRVAYRPFVEPLLYSYVVPDMSSTYAPLRLRAAWTVERFSDSKFRDKTQYNAMLEQLIVLCNDREAPVRVAAFLSLRLAFQRNSGTHWKAANKNACESFSRDSCSSANHHCSFDASSAIPARLAWRDFV